MREIAHQILIGAASIFLAPTGTLPGPRYRITLPPPSATEAIAGDFARASSDFVKATRKIEQATQLELSI
jgi:hypothetical protein